MCDVYIKDLKLAQVSSSNVRRVSVTDRNSCNVAQSAEAPLWLEHGYSTLCIRFAEIFAYAT